MIDHQSVAEHLVVEIEEHNFEQSMKNTDTSFVLKFELHPENPR